MVDLILIVFILAVFVAGIWVGATFGGLEALWGKIRASLRKKLDDDEGKPPAPPAP